MDIEKLLKDITIDDIPEQYRVIAEILGFKILMKFCDYVNGDYIYIPRKEKILLSARDRVIRKEYNGYNVKELSVKYNLTRTHIYNIVKNDNSLK